MGHFILSAQSPLTKMAFDQYPRSHMSLVDAEHHTPSSIRAQALLGSYLCLSNVILLFMATPAGLQPL